VLRLRCAVLCCAVLCYAALCCAALCARATSPFAISPSPPEINHTPNQPHRPAPHTTTHPVPLINRTTNRTTPQLSGFHVPPGCWDAKVIDALRPGADEMVLPKSTSSVFSSTTLHYGELGPPAGRGEGVSLGRAGGGGGAWKLQDPSLLRDSHLRIPPPNRNQSTTPKTQPTDHPQNQPRPRRHPLINRPRPPPTTTRATAPPPPPQSCATWGATAT